MNPNWGSIFCAGGTDYPPDIEFHPVVLLRLFTLPFYLGQIILLIRSFYWSQNSGYPGQIIMRSEQHLGLFGSIYTLNEKSTNRQNVTTSPRICAPHPPSVIGCKPEPCSVRYLEDKHTPSGVGVLKLALNSAAGERRYFQCDNNTHSANVCNP